MANLTPAATWDDVYQIEALDQVQGGAGQLSNFQGQQLVNRTQFLRDMLDPLDHSKMFYKTIQLPSGGGSTTLLTTQFGVLFTSQSYAVQNVTLPLLADCDDDTMYSFFVTSQHAGGSGPFNPFIKLIGQTGDFILEDLNANNIGNTYWIYEGGVCVKKFPGATHWSVVHRWGTEQSASIKMFASGTQGKAWLLCDGSTYSNSGSSAFTELFQRIQYTFGGSGTNYQVPNMADPVTGVSYYIHV